MTSKDTAGKGGDLISGPPGEAPVLVVEATWARRTLELGLGVVQGLGCLFIVLLAVHTSPVFWPFAAFPALVSVQFLQRAFNGRPRLVLDSEGITDRTAAGSGPVRIPWSAVVRVSGSWGGIIELEAKDPKWLRSHVGIARRVQMTMLRKRTFSVAPALLGISSSDLRTKMGWELEQFERRALGMKAEVPTRGDDVGR